MTKLKDHFLICSDRVENNLYRMKKQKMTALISKLFTI